MDTEQTKAQREMLSSLMDGQLHGAAFANTVEQLTEDVAARADWHCYHVVGDILRSPELANCAADSAFMSRFQARLAQEPRFDRPAFLPESAPQFASELVAAAAPSNVANISDAKNKAQAKHDQAANESSFRWKLVAGFASLAAVSAIGWNMLAVSAPSMNGAQLAQANEVFRQSPSPVVLASAAMPAGPVLISTTVGVTDSAAQLPHTAGPAAQVAGLPAGVTAQTVTLPGSGEPQVMIRSARLDALMAAHKQFGGASALQTPAPFLREATFDEPGQ